MDYFVMYQPIDSVGLVQSETTWNLVNDALVEMHYLIDNHKARVAYVMAYDPKNVLQWPTTRAGRALNMTTAEFRNYVHE